MCDENIFYDFYFKKFYLKESILSKEKFLLWRCNDLDLSNSVKDRRCPFNEKEIVPMGELATLDGFHYGIFYLTSQQESPFSCPAFDFEC